MKNLPTNIAELAQLLDINLDEFDQIIRNAPDQYRPRIMTKNGKTRRIDRPNEELKDTQRILNKVFFQKFDVNPQICARRNSTIKDALMPHVGQPVVVTLDLKDFFPSIKAWYLKEKFEKLGFAPEITKALVRLTTYKKRLPQGAPTSPVVSQIYISDYIDNLYSYVSKIPNTNLTVYVDDIIMSGPHGIQKSISGIKKIAQRYGLEINKKKVRIMKTVHEQQALGVYLNPLHVSPEFNERLNNAKEMKLHLRYQGMIAFKNFIEN